MEPIIALLIQTAAAVGPAPVGRLPKLDEGWVFPISESKSATADCPVIGRTSAEFKFAAGRTRVVGVRGLGRVADEADLRKIDEMIGPMQGLSDVTVSCWGHIAAFVQVKGIFNVDGSPRQESVRFLWRANGPVRLSETAIYPSVPRLAAPDGEARR